MKKMAMVLIPILLVSWTMVVFGSYAEMGNLNFVDSNGNATPLVSSIRRNWQATENEITIEQGSTDPADSLKTALKISYTNTSKAVEIHSSRLIDEGADPVSTVIEFDVYTNSSSVRSNLVVSAAYSKTDGDLTGDVISSVRLRPADSVSLQKFIADTDGWQTVTIPVNYFPDTVTWWASGNPQITFDWNEASYYRIAANAAITGDVYIRNWKVRYNNAVGTDSEMFKHLLITENGEVTDPWSEDYKYGLKSLVPYWNAPEGAVTVAMGAQDPEDITKTAGNIVYNSTNAPVEGYFEPVYIVNATRNFTTLTFDLYSNSSAGRNLSLAFRYAYNESDITNSLNISPYIEDIDGWQTVNVPLSDYSSEGMNWATNPWTPIEFDWGKISTFRLSLAEEGSANIFVRNMYYTVGENETRNHYFEDYNGVINLMDSGTFRSGDRPLANDTRVGGVGYVTYTRETLLPEVADGVKCRRLQFNKMNSGWFIGRIDKANVFQSLESSTHDYSLYLRVKLLNKNPMSMILGYLPSWNSNTFNVIGHIGDSLKPTTDWQTLIIPLDKFADVNLSSINAIGLDAKGMTPTYYVSDFKLIPNELVFGNRFDFENIITEDIDLFKHGEIGKDCNDIAVSGTAGTLNSYFLLQQYDYNDSECPSAYYNTIIKMWAKESGTGVSFDISDHPITDENYKNMALKLMIKNTSDTNTNFRVVRSGNGIRDEFRIYGQATTDWRMQFIPLERFTNNSALSWADVDKIHIEGISYPWDSYMYYFDNVAVCSIREGYVSGNTKDLSIADNTLSFSHQISNTMTSNYEYVAKEIPVIGIYEGIKLTDVKLFENISATAEANSAVNVQKTYNIPPIPSGSAIIKLFSLNNLNDIKPMGDVEVRQYFSFD